MATGQQFKAALGEAYPLLLGMGSSLQQGQGVGPGLQGGLAMMLGLQEKKREREEERAERLRQEQMRAQGLQMTAAALGGGLGGMAGFGGGQVAPMNPDVAIADDAMRALGKTDMVSPGGRLMADLQRDFGFSPEQAAGVVGNLAHETGGFNQMQEIEPVVPGSRGGFGFAQWTGPRRRAFEQWSAANNLDPNSYEANYGFLKHELTNTPEGRVVPSLRNAETAEEAAKLFSQQFLRPGVPHMDSRVSQARQFANMSPERAAQVLNHPNVSPAVKQMVLAQFQPQQEDTTSLRQNVEWIMQNNPGMPFQDALKMAKGGVNVNVNTGDGGPRPIADKPAKGYQRIWDEERQTYVDKPIPGGDVEAERSGEVRAADLAAADFSRKSDIVNTNLDAAISALEEDGRWVAGYGSLLSGLPESSARDFQARLDTIKANLGFEELQAMRDASPTGGALGQVSEREIAFLQAIQGNLDAAQSPGQLLDILKEVKKRRAEFAADRERILSQNFTAKQAGDLESRIRNMPDFGSMSDAELDAWISENGG